MKKWYSTLFLLLPFICVTQLGAQQGSERDLKNILLPQLSRLHISASQLNEAVISDSYTETQSKVRYIYLQQRWQGVNVYNQILTIIVRNDSVLSVAGRFFDGFGLQSSSALPGIRAEQAIMMTARHFNLPVPKQLTLVEDRSGTATKMSFSPGGIAKKNIETQLYWVIVKDTIAKLAWNVNIDLMDSPDWWNVRVDAATGEIIEKDSWTVNEVLSRTSLGTNRPLETRDRTGMKDPLFAARVDGLDRSEKSKSDGQRPTFPPPTITNAGYFVVPFPFESPRHHALVIENEPWLKAGAGNAAASDGWHFDGTTNYSITRGNNVFAYLDAGNSNAPNAATNWPDTSTTAIPALTFNFPPDFNQYSGATVNKRSAVTNLFYWNNLMHDVFYQYGFTEAAGNFQTDNQGRGGTGNDYVQAEGQDASGTSNANFSTPGDGQRPRMQMYLWSSTPTFTVNTPVSIAGTYATLESSFSTNNKLADLGPITGQVIYFNDDAAGTAHLACGTPANFLTGKIAMIDRGTCNFTVKVKNAQTAGAIGVIMVNNIAGSPIVMGGTDNTITIPAIMLSQADGATLAGQLSNDVTVTMAGGIGFDGDLDNSIICHEYGHGISSRLTGGPANSSCLSNAERGSEGWSDYMALMMLTNWGTALTSDGTLSRTIGTYAANQPTTGGGIRNYPYSTNIAVNPLVYSVNLPSEIHDLGEYWCIALWEMTWEMIQVDGINPNLFNGTGTGGNSAALKLVVEGMKLQTCNPGFIDARNAILKADTIFFAARYSCAIWKAFAKRGMGWNASQGSPNTISDQVPDFSMGAAVITANPATTAACAGSTVNFHVTANGSGLIYQWQISTNGGSSFSDIASANSSQLTLNAVTVALNNNQYRCVVSGACSAGSTSNPAILTVAAGPVINTQPVPQTVCSGSNAQFTVAASGTVQGYQWQVSTDGGANFTTITGATTPTLSLTAVTVAMNNNQYRCLLTASCGSGLNSNAATLSVNSSAAITAQPNNDAVCNGGIASFTVAATGTAAGYQWQVSTDNGSTFSNVPGATTATLSLTGVTFGMNNYQYRAQLTSSCAGAISEAAILTVLGPPAIATQPVSATVCAGTTGHFSVSATGPVQGYQWEVSMDAGNSFTAIPGATGSALEIPSLTIAQDGYLYRCVIHGDCADMTSGAAALSINPEPEFTLGTLPATLCVSDPAITLSASDPTGSWTGTGTQNSTFTPSVAGIGPAALTYTVTNTIACSHAIQATIQINECADRHLGLGAPNALVLYPNPNDGRFKVRIHTDLYSQLSVRVYSSDGKFIRQLSFQGLLYDQLVDVNLSGLASGTYFLYFFNKDNNALQKKIMGIVISQ